ncbi:MAG: PEP-CTERM sorting domain-containing protein [Terriglobales bacterium]|jgi:hypothetical protein
MLSRCRFLLSLVAALSLSTLASANSAPINMTSLHSGASSVYSGTRAYPGNLPITDGKGTPARFDTFNQASTGANGSGLTLGRETLGRSTASYNSRVAFQNGNSMTSRSEFVWKVGTPFQRPTSPMSTPEPGSLLLLSTGLIGFAGLIRRKLRG